jgi:hypothetical protein
VTFRALAWLAFLAGTATLAGGLALIGELPGQPAAARHLRAMKRRVESPLAVTPARLEDFLALPYRPALAARAAIEGRAVSFEGWTQRIILAGDGDLHLELAPSPRAVGAFDTAYVTAEITPRWRAGAPGWSFDRIVEALRPPHGGTTAWDGGATRVRVSGWLLDDYQYDRRPSPWTLAHGAPRVSGWEIHPVTRIERWDDAHGGWLEVDR